MKSILLVLSLVVLQAALGHCKVRKQYGKGGEHSKKEKRNHGSVLYRHHGVRRGVEAYPKYEVPRDIVYGHHPHSKRAEPSTYPRPWDHTKNQGYDFETKPKQASDPGYGYNGRSDQQGSGNANKFEVFMQPYAENGFGRDRGRNYAESFDAPSRGNEKRNHQRQNVKSYVKSFKLDKNMKLKPDNDKKSGSDSDDDTAASFKFFVRVPVPVEVPKPYPVHVPKPFPVTVVRPVPFPVLRKIPVPVQVPVPKPFPVLVPKEAYNQQRQPQQQPQQQFRYQNPAPSGPLLGQFNHFFSHNQQNQQHHQNQQYNPIQHPFGVLEEYRSPIQ